MALYSLFGMGFIVVVTGSIRTYYMNYLINGTFDVMWYLWIMYVWTMLELDLAIVAASAPALKPFFRRFLIEPLSTRGGRSNGRYGYGYTISSGQRASYASKDRMRATVASPTDLNKVTFRDEATDPDRIGTAISDYAEDKKNHYELSERPFIKMQKTYEVTSEIASDDDSTGSMSKPYMEPPFAEPVAGYQNSRQGYTTQNHQSPKRERSTSRVSERSAFSGESLGKGTLDSTTWPEESVPWDPAERIKYYARQP
ncbi:MAG: hypothetical protein Q9227_007161 [Pyrenula ochraceoflavens]